MSGAPLDWAKEGSGFKVQGSGFRVQGSGFKVQGSRFKVQGSRFTVQGSRLWWRLRREYIWGDARRSVDRRYSRIIALPLEGKVPRNGG